MARKPVQIDVASDTRQFSKGIQTGVITPLDNVVDAMADVSREAETSGDAMEDAAREAGRQYGDLGDDASDAFKDLSRSSSTEMDKAQADTEALKKEHKDLQDVINKGSKTSFKKFADHADTSTTKASENVDEFKDEANANFSEVASSFSGDMDSAVDLVQGTLGGLAGSIPGGVGLALGGLGAAAGLFYNQWSENAEKTKQVMSDMYDDMLDSGETYLSDDYKQTEYYNILRGNSDVVKLNNVKAIAEETKMSNQEVALAFAGDGEAMEKVVENLTSARKDAADKVTDGYGDEQEAVQDTIGKIDRLIDVSKNRTDSIKETSAEVQASTAFWELNGTESAKAMQQQYEDVERNRGAIVGAKDDVGELTKKITDVPDSHTLKVVVEAANVRSRIQTILDQPFSIRVAPRESNIRNGKYMP